MRICEKCHLENSDGSMFCIGCGTQLANGRQGPAQPQQEFTQPQQEFTQSQQGFTQPQQEFTQSQQGFAQPQQEFAQSQQGFTQPQQGFAQPQQGFAQPQQGFAQPQQGPVQPQQFQPANKKSVTQKWWFWTLIAAAGIVLLVAGIAVVSFLRMNNDSIIVSPAGSEGSTEEPGGNSAIKPAQQGGTYKIGEKLTITQDGKAIYTITINSAKLTTERSKYDTSNPKSVVIINYTYENLASEEDINIYDSYFKVIDADGNVCDDYYGVAKNYSKSTPIGAKCTADAAFGLMSDKKEFKLMFYSEYFGDKADGTFELTAE